MEWLGAAVFLLWFTFEVLIGWMCWKWGLDRCGCSDNKDELAKISKGEYVIHETTCTDSLAMCCEIEKMLQPIEPQKTKCRYCGVNIKVNQKCPHCGGRQ